MANILQLRRGTTAQNDAFTGSVAEVTVDTDRDSLRVHDGVTVGGKEIADLATAIPLLTDATTVGPADEFVVRQSGIVKRATSNEFLNGTGTVTATGSTTGRTLATRFADTINVKDFGAIGDGVANDTAAIQAAITASPVVMFPAGNYLLTSAISVPSNRTIIGTSANLIFDGSARNCVTLSSVSNVQIEGLTMTSSAIAPNSTFASINIVACSNVSIRECSAIAANLIRCTSSGANYAAVIADESDPNFNCSRDIKIVDCESAGAGAVGTAISVRYSIRWSINNCRVFNCRHGIDFWGGDSNPAVNGALVNERKSQLGVIANCIVHNASLGGIWGSMGQNISITGCVVENCGDVGIDFEGCFDCSATGNSVYNATNGGLTIFFLNRNITFSGNSVVQPAERPCLRVYNSGLSADNKSLVVTGNTFRSETGISAVDCNSGPVESIVVVGNIFQNVRLAPSSNNSRYVTVSGNSLLFTINSLNAVTAGTCTITIASPAVITKTAHGLLADTPVVFSTTGALPTGLTAGTIYYVLSSGLGADSFEVSTTVGGSAVNTSGSQSGTHTVTVVSAFAGIFVNALNGGNGGRSFIGNNTVISTATQPAGSQGISVRQTDFNQFGRHFITGNMINGFPVDIETDNAGSNAGRFGRFIITNNSLGTPSYVRTETGAANSVVFIKNNNHNGEYWPNAVPTTGRWDAGTIVYDDTPSAGDTVGWVCVTTGEPGTWQKFGGINLSGSATFNPGNLIDGDGETTTVTVTGAALGDYAEASFSLDLQGITVTAWVSAADTVSVRFQNETGGTINLGSGTLRARVFKP